MLMTMMAWFMALQSFAHTWNPDFKGVEAMKASGATWSAVSSHPNAKKIWVRWWAMAASESCFKVRKYRPEVGQRTDYHGAHYNLLAYQGAKRGLVRWPAGMKWEIFKKTHQYRLFKTWLNAHPEEGDALALRAFADLVDDYGLDVATAGWKVDPSAYLKGEILVNKRGHGPYNKQQRSFVEAFWNGGGYLLQVQRHERSFLKLVPKE